MEEQHQDREQHADVVDEEQAAGSLGLGVCNGRRGAAASIGVVLLLAAV
jgi:hypothetical protein